MNDLAAPDFGSPRFKANPFPFYARLRAEAPVFPVKIPFAARAWLVTRYDDVAALLKAPGFSKDRFSNMIRDGRAPIRWLLKLVGPITQNMLERDPPEHTRLRSLVHKAFTPRLIERLRGRVQTVADELLDAAQRKGALELVSDYALPVPTIIIADMLGVPASDHRKFQRWSNHFISNSSLGGFVSSVPSLLSFMRYIRKLIEHRRAAPADDLLSALIQAEEAGARLSQEELVAMVFLLLVAGHETTVNLIAGGTLALLQHPEQLERLRQDPSLVEPAVEELLRYTSPVELATHRIAREDVMIAGTPIRRGDMILAVLASANRDEAHFTQPDTLDLSRQPNKHLSLGLGIHYCVGAPLARLEGQITLQTLVRRFPRLRLAKPAESIRWRTGFLMRGPLKLPVAL
jgi:cytochrome P450